jgi:DNA polymerase-3 subunit gamma/tau
MIVNPDAEKLIKTSVRDGGITKVVILPGVPNAAPKKARAARAGSPEAKAKEHPMIQQAQRLFDAEIRNVIDLSEGN